MPISVIGSDGTARRVVVREEGVQYTEMPEEEEVDNNFAHAGSYYFDATQAGRYGVQIEEYVFDSSLSDSFKVPDAHYLLRLKTTYPGLLIGSGYPHPKLPENTDDFQLGFFFDHTTGVPVIPGSTVKGVLRSHFLHLHNTDDPQAQTSTVILLEEATDESQLDLDAFAKWSDEKKAPLIQKWINIEQEIFAGVDVDEGTLLSRNRQDRFYDAYIVDTDDGDGRIFADDYITPHSDPLQNPQPIRFLKIRSQVHFCFQFDLHDGLLMANQKMTLFKNLLLFGGAGAKTTVGYGQFDEAGECDEPHPGDG
jgi:CRISPR-associated protein Cmr6